MFTEFVNEMINAGGVSDEKIVADLIMSHNNLAMIEGVRYYNNENDILRRKAYRFDSGVKIEDETKQNRRLNHNWHKLLVDQKTSYLLGRPVKFSADDVDLTAIINKGLGERFDDVLCELSKGASNKGIEWLQLFINEDGGFDFAIIPAEQVIPIWDTSLQKRLVGLIRYYEVSRAVGGSELLVEWWSENSVKHFVRDTSGRVDFVKEDCHFYQNGAGFGWGRVPFVPFKNNEEMVNDLKFYKNLVDDYDLCVSDLSNNLAEVQEVVTVLKGYEGTDLREFSENLRYYKVIKVAAGDGSGVDKLEISIPIEAKREMLNRLEENIFTFGQGINVKSDKFGNAASGVALKFLYSLLDMKTGITERKFVVAIKEVIWFLCEYIAMTGGGKFESSTVAVVFSRRLIANELELAQIAQGSKGIISDETIIAHHPWTEDVDFEMKNVK